MTTLLENTHIHFLRNKEARKEEGKRIERKTLMYN